MRNLLVGIAVAAGVWGADARRGAILIDDAGCLECHTVRGQGAGHEPSGAAPELGSGLVPAYTVPALAAAVWNHTPSMLAGFPERRLSQANLVAKDWDDIFAYLYSTQFLEFPAEIGRGKQAFQGKQCANCHSLADPALGPGSPVAAWKPVSDPATLIYGMWTHSSYMEESGREAPWVKTGWTKLTGRDVLDLSAYLQQVQREVPQHDAALPDSLEGKAPFDQKCGNCHAGPLALEKNLSNTMWADIAAGMWNHVQLMRRVPAVTEPEMRAILSYVWDLQYRGPEGNAELGEQAFRVNGCASCHGVHGMGIPVTPADIAAIGWGEGRRMHQRVLNEGMAWPHLSAGDVADIVAYINSRKPATGRFRDPE